MPVGTSVQVRAKLVTVSRLARVGIHVAPVVKIVAVGAVAVTLHVAVDVATVASCVSADSMVIGVAARAAIASREAAVAAMPSRYCYG